MTESRVEAPAHLTDHLEAVGLVGDVLLGSVEVEDAAFDVEPLKAVRVSARLAAASSAAC